MSDELLGKEIQGRYKITGILGQGGMGIVYQAQDLRLNQRPCAIKLLKGQTTDPLEAKRFEGELQIISRLRSPNVVQVLDTGRMPDQRLYIVMELLEGEPLSNFLKKEGSLIPIRAIQIVKGVLAALSEAHEFGIVHRDLKPANIFITQSRTGDEIAKVLDFGIAKDTNNDENMGLTSASMIIGTPKYMAPEQFMKLATDARTDIYAVGLLLYQLLTGRPPFLPEDPELPANMASMPAEFKIGWLHLNAMPKKGNISDSLWNIITKLIAKEANDRVESAQKAIELLNQALQEITGFNGTFSTGMFNSINLPPQSNSFSQQQQASIHAPNPTPSNPSKPFQNLQTPVNQQNLQQSYPNQQKQQLQSTPIPSSLQSLALAQQEQTAGISFDEIQLLNQDDPSSRPKKKSFLPILLVAVVVIATITVVYLQQKKTTPKKTTLTEFCFHDIQPIPPDVELVITQTAPPSRQPNLPLNISRQCAQTLEIEIKAKAPGKTYLTEKLILSGSEKKQKHPIVFKIDPKATNLQDLEEKDQKPIKGNDKDLNKKDKNDKNDKNDKKTQPSIKKIKSTESEDRVEDQDQAQTIPTKKEIQLTPKKASEKAPEKAPEKMPEKEKTPEPSPEKTPEVLPF